MTAIAMTIADIVIITSAIIAIIFLKSIYIPKDCKIFIIKFINNEPKEMS